MFYILFYKNCLGNKVSKKYIISMKFRLKKDWYIDNFFDKVKIYDEGHIFTLNEEGNYIIENPINGGKTKMSFDDMLKATDNGEPLFETINEQEIELTLEEVTEDKDNEVKKWRIQLDVNTSLNKLKLIQKFLQENIPDLL
jgi:hypothetical protein